MTRPAEPPTPASLCRELGLSHRRRDDSAGREARVRQQHDRDRVAAARERWPAITAAMCALIKCYNDGAGLEALTLIGHPERGSDEPEVEIVAGSGRTLTVALDGGELRIGPRRGTTDPSERTWWMSLTDRTDGAAAAYALQAWMTRL